MWPPYPVRNPRRRRMRRSWCQWECVMDMPEIVIRRETEAAKLLIAGLRNTISDEDMALLADTLEGETNLFEAIDTALAEIDATELLVSGLKQKEGQSYARRQA